MCEGKRKTREVGWRIIEMIRGLSTASVCQVIGETGWQGSQESVETPTGSFTFHQNCPHLPHLPRLVTRQLTLFRTPKPKHPKLGKILGLIRGVFATAPLKPTTN